MAVLSRQSTGFGDMMSDWSFKQKVLRETILLTTAARTWPIARTKPFTWGVRWASNHLVPWAARMGFQEGIHEVNGIRMEIPRPPDWGGGGEFHMALGTYERHELDYLLSRLRPGDTFIDIGAHIGYLTLPIARRVGPRGRVIALEPFPESVGLLRRNVALNGFEWITVVEAAVCDHDGQAQLAVSEQSPMWNSLTHTPVGTERGGISVTTRSLDSLLAEAGWPVVAGIKLDVEGAEAEALRGSIETLARNPQALLLLEVAGGDRMQTSLETLDCLEQLGYRFRRLLRGGAGPVVSGTELVGFLHRRGWHESLFNVVGEHA